MEQNIDLNFPAEFLFFQKELILNPENNELLGYAIFYPVEGILEERTQQIIQLKFNLYCLIVDSKKKENIEEIKKKVFNTYLMSLPVRYILSQKKISFNDEKYTNKLHVDLYNQLGIFRNSLNTELEYVHFFENLNFENVILQMNLSISNQSLNHSSQSNETPEEKLNKIIKNSDSIFEYPGYHDDANGASPWKAFASHLESSTDGGLAKGQFDGHFDRKALERNVPYGIVNGNGNRQKLKDIIRFGILKPDNEIYEFVQNILLAKNSKERIDILEAYLTKINKKYDDISYAIDLGEGKLKRQTFFTHSIVPLFKQLYQIQQNK